MMTIEVVYATPDRQELIELSVEEGATAGEAIEQSGIVARFPGLDPGAQGIGIWGQPVSASQRLRDGDRVEIYRPLQMDPREARRQLAAHGGAMGQKPTDGE